MRRAAAIPPILLAAAALAPGGCGATSNSSDKFHGPAKDVASAIDDLRDAGRSHDGGKICDELFTPQLKAQLGGANCSKRVKNSVIDVDAFDISVVPNGIRITGNQATVRIKTDVSRGRDPVDTLHMVNQQGWRIDRLP